MVRGLPARLASLFLIVGVACSVTGVTLAGSSGPVSAPPGSEGPVNDTTAGHFRKVVLARADQMTDPMELAVASDGRVFFVEREGAVKLWNPNTGRVQMVGFVPTWATHNEGMMGIALDPNFDRNGWLYVYDSPLGPENHNQVMRFTVRGNEIDPASKKVLLTVETDRSHCCHSGGSLAFGPDGSLYIGTGDNMNPHASDGFAPMDERPGRKGFDSQGSAANTQDLRGKVLRIKPQPDGTYTIPQGNLFPDGKGGRPEIFAMGTRNAFRLNVDQETGWVYWGDVGPDSGTDNPERGPQSYDEINQGRVAGNYGWPYFVGNNRPYRDYDFATGESGPYFDPAHPVNDSPNNTGARVLPPAVKPLIWYPYGPSEEFPELGTGGRVAMAGPVYHYDPEHVGPYGLPAAYDGSLFIYDWARGWIKEVELDADGHVQEIKPFLSDMEFHRPMDMELGPDGSLYMLEWGTDYEGSNDDVQLIRIEYIQSDAAATTAVASATPSQTPQLTFTWPVNGGFFAFGEPIRYEVAAKGGAQIQSDQVTVQPYQGYNTYTLPLETRRGAAGTVVIPPEDNQAPYVVNRFAELDVVYADGNGGEPEASGRVILHPKHMQAEHYTARKDVDREVKGSIRTKSPDVVISMVVKDGGWLLYRPVNLANIDSLAFRVAPLQGGSIDVRLDAPEGRLLATVRVAGSQAPVQDGDEAEAEDIWQMLRVPVQDPGGTHDLYLVAHGTGDDPLMKLDRIDFIGMGLSAAK